MEISLLLAQQILQLFLILLMGYAVVRCGLLKAADSRVLSVVMVYLALPCVVLKAFQIDDSPALRTGLLYAFAIAVLLHLLFLALTAVLKRPLQLDVIEGATLIYSNAAQSSALYVLSTLLSIVTMPVMIGLFALAFPA